MSSRDRQAWALLLPLLVIILTVTGYPLISTVRLSFTDASLTGRHVAQHWVGFENYAYVFTDPDFGDAFRRTLYFTFVSVGFEILLGVLVALLLNREFAGRTIVRAIMVLPWALPTIVNAMMWRLIYNPEFGAWNALLSQLGLIDSYQSWLGTPGTAMNMVILADVWKNYPLVAIIVLAALQTIPRELYEAADIDGAGPWVKFWKVTFPAILGPLSVALILRMIEAFKVFDIIYLMTRGGPADTTKSVSFFVYQESFAYLRAGSGASYAVTVALTSAVMIAIYITLLRRQGSTA
ncbi:MAG TPA: sugar ABC transporter permease [Verrucomicrobiae bacterium]|nr:sugar ABC transporter permease [Verrucomicrobiae bacterium]